MFVQCGENLDEWSSRYTFDLDPFYDPPKHKLVGVAVLFLQPLSFLVDIAERPAVVSFKGEVVGELEVEVSAMLESQRRRLGEGNPSFQVAPHQAAAKRCECFDE